MVLNEEQVKSIKEQILKQIDTWQASEEKKQQARQYIQSLNAEQLEQFLIQNKKRGYSYEKFIIHLHVCFWSCFELECG